MTLKDSELYNHMRHKFFSMANSTSAIPESSNAFYYVREPHGKRPARNFEDDYSEYVPRTKKRFERVNSMLHDFSISNDKPFLVESSDDDMGECEVSSPASPVIVEEPEDTSPSYVELDSTLKGYLERAKQSPNLLPSSLNAVRGDEVTIWRPLKTLNPFDDPTMSGRICEIADEDDNEELKDGQDDGKVYTPPTSDAEMSTESSPHNSPLIIELSEDELSVCSGSSSDSMEVDY